MSKYLELLPAVDVADGKAVRLTQGEAGSETDYGSPMEAAQTWINAGAEWIHLVDLDAAFGRGDNRAVIRQVVDSAKTELGRGVKIELSGGIRDDASLEAALEAGATRVNLGTAALENPDWTEKVIAKFGDATPDEIQALLGAGLVLFLLTLIVNLIANWIVARSSRERLV